MSSPTESWRVFYASRDALAKVRTASPRRVRVHVPAHDGWPESVRGVGSEVVCVKCGARCRGRSHAEARKALRFHRLDGCA